MPISTTRRAARLRSALFTSAALAGLVIAGAATAQTVGKPTGAYLESQNGPSIAPATSDGPSNAYLEPQGGNPVKLDPVAPEPAIVIANPNTPTTARDPNNVTGIGQMVVDQGGGYIGLCTGTLINPRTVIFAAHCVNTQAANSYGANTGGTPIGFGFETNTRANNPGETDELVRWLLGGTGGAGKDQTNIAQSFYNANYVAYNPYSLEPAAQGFLYGDVALATLDTPAANVPTWALMFSPLTNTGTIGAAGTGFNVNLVGYGNNGTGQAGSGSIDYRRRAAENILGALTDLQTFESFLFGGAPNGLTQNLYFLDFDDPRRGMSGASPFDFNAFRDNSVASGKEGITASGDSGGPLIVTNFSKQLVIGVLSGGYTRFFAAQPANGYGTVSFYQPLYLYWDWIAANNPYHYVAATAGNGSWTDATHWVSTLDPAYNILVGGQVVNGVPTVAGEQKNGTSGDFGQICYQTTSSSDCYDTRTGIETYDPSGHPIGTAANGDSDTAAAGTATKPTGIAGFDGVTLEAQNNVTTVALPTPTIANGLPGATNFVPNNSDPVRATSTAGRYYDVTLAATGTTTLTGANVTIDRLTIGTSGAQLVIDAGASLTTLINTTQFAGFNTVNGTLTSVGDYSLFGGGLLGTGRINAPFLTSMLGQIAPGTTSTIGTLTVGGNLILASGNTYFVNLGGAASSDLLAVVANGSSTGVANVGGTVQFSAATGATIRFNDLYTIVTAQGGVTGAFASPASISAILSPSFVYSANAVQVRVLAGSYVSVVDPNSPTQLAYARLLDGNRANSYNALSALYGPLDLQSQATIRATLASFAPGTETLKTSQGTVASDNMARFYRQRLAQMGDGNANGGTVAVIGQPLSVLSSLNNVGPMGSMGADGAAPQTASVSTGQVPDDTAVYFAGGYLEGNSRPMTGMTGRDIFHGWYAAAGVEKQASETVSVGLAGSYTRLDGTTSTGTGSARGELYQGTVYGKLATHSGIGVDMIASAGLFDNSTRRGVTLIATPYTLTARDRSLALSGELGVGFMPKVGSLTVGPRAAIRYSEIGFSTTAEAGGPMALRVDRRTLRSTQGRAGAELGGGDKIKPYLSGYYVHDFNDAPASFGANFVGGLGPNAAFALSGQDKDWFEVAGGLSVRAGNIELSAGADTTIDRRDVKNQSYRGSIKFHF